MTLTAIQNAICIAAFLASGQVIAARAAGTSPLEASACALSGLCRPGRAAPAQGPLVDGWIFPAKSGAALARPEGPPPFHAKADPSIVITPLPPSSVMMLAGLALIAVISLRKRRRR